MVQLLLDQGALPSPRDADGNTPLQDAAASGHEDVVEFLLGTGHADAGSANEEGMTALHDACANIGRLRDESNVRIAMSLLKRPEVDPTYVCNGGKTALDFAACNGITPVVAEIVMRDGVDVNRTDEYNFTPLHLAARWGFLDTMKAILRKPEANRKTRDFEGRTLLSNAARKGHLDVVKYLLDDLSADPNIADNNGLRPIHHAAEGGNDAVMGALLEHGAVDPNSRASNTKQTPLIKSVMCSKIPVVERLVKDVRVDVDLEDRRGSTALHHASKRGDKTIVSSLLKRRAKVNVMDNLRRTPLSLAAMIGAKEVVETLLAVVEVDPNTRDHLGRSSLSWSARGRPYRLSSDFIGSVRLLVADPRVDVNLRDNHGRTPVLLAAGTGHVEIVRVLLETIGVNAEIMDNNGWTPMQWAKEKGHDEIVALLQSRAQTVEDSPVA